MDRFVAIHPMEIATKKGTISIRNLLKKEVFLFIHLLVTAIA